MTTLAVRRAAPAICLLVALAALVFLLEVGTPIHLHRGDGPALYNGECLLAALTACHGLATLAAPPASSAAVLVVGAVALGATAPPAKLLVCSTDTRAPPLA